MAGATPAIDMRQSANLKMTLHHLTALVRRWRFTIIGLVWAVGLVGILGTVPQPVVVVHWANGHMVDRDTLFPAFAKEFSGAGHRTESGRPVKVQIVRANSGEITGELIARIGRGTRLDRGKPDPTVVTPAADHWLNEVNEALGRTVVDLAKLQTPATTYIGIVTTRELARCMGWPARDISFAEVVASATGTSPDRASLAPACSALQEARVAFTYPTRSSTARSMLYSLYALAAGKTPERLTMQDISQPAVQDYLAAFQHAIDCYVPDTLDLNRKILLEPSCAHFYFLAEDNLVKLYQGKIEDRPGVPKALDRDLVMMYPREGAIVHNHSAFVVQPNVASPEHAEAVNRWIAFLMQESQQQAFMQEGFRRGTEGVCVEPLGSPFRPCAVQPKTVIYPDRIDAKVAVEAIRNWR